MTTTTRLVAALGAVLVFSLLGTSLRAQSGEDRRPAKHLVTPVVPELAKRLSLSGTVRIEVVVAPNGTVKRTRVIGGHPVLAVEAERAAQKSTFEAGPRETIEIIDFKF